MQKFKKIYIEITNICNLNCSFCSKVERPLKNMKLKEFEEIFKVAMVDTNVKRTWYVGDENYYYDLLERNEIAILVDRIKEYNR